MSEESLTKLGNNRPSISVAMATYNGEKYIVEQINSIISQFNEGDELVISYDKSTDRTYEIITGFAKQYPCVKVIENQNRGVLHNFENAIINCKNEIIFLSDQDDVWAENKVNIVLSYMHKYDADYVVHGALVVDEKLEPIEKYNANVKEMHEITTRSIFIKNCVQGSCLAFKKEYLDKILPLPQKIPMHDSWIGLIISKYGKGIYIKEKLLLYRQHESNVTSRDHKLSGITKMITDRVNLLRAYRRRIKEIKKNGK